MQKFLNMEELDPSDVERIGANNIDQGNVIWRQLYQKRLAKTVDKSKIWNKFVHCMSKLAKCFQPGKNNYTKKQSIYSVKLRSLVTYKM